MLLASNLREVSRSMSMSGRTCVCRRRRVTISASQARPVPLPWRASAGPLMRVSPPARRHQQEIAKNRARPVPARRLRRVTRSQSPPGPVRVGPVRFIQLRKEHNSSSRFQSFGPPRRLREERCSSTGTALGMSVSALSGTFHIGYVA